MKNSLHHLRSRFAEISFLGFLLVLAGRASFASELPENSGPAAPIAIAQTIAR